VKEFRERGEKPYIDGLIVTEWYKRAEKEGRCPGKSVYSMFSAKPIIQVNGACGPCII
jgi:hypothetical protein